MVCPLCNNQMQEGLLEGNEGISWYQPQAYLNKAYPIDNEGIIWTQPDKQPDSYGEVNLPGATGWKAFWGGAEVPAHICRKCRKIIISY